MQIVMDNRTWIDIDCILDIDGDIYARTNDSGIDWLGLYDQRCRDFHRKQD